jgi:hypothetical protein
MARHRTQAAGALERVADSPATRRNMASASEARTIVAIDRLDKLRALFADFERLTGKPEAITVLARAVAVWIEIAAGPTRARLRAPVM